MAKKNFYRKKAPKYTLREIIEYHRRRDDNPRSAGILYGSRQHAYSSGFMDGAAGYSHYAFGKATFDAKGARGACALGFARGKKVRQLTKARISRGYGLLED